MSRDAGRSVAPSDGPADRFAIRHPTASFALAFGVLLSIIFAMPLFTKDTFAGRDLVPFFLPIEKVVHASWRHGHLPLTLAEVSYGRALAANPNSGVFYPPRIAMALLPFRFSFKLFPLLHLWIAGIGAFLLARLLGISWNGASLAGIVYGLSGPAFSEVEYPNILPGLALLPLVVWSAGRVARRRSWRGLSLFSLLLGIDLLTGDVFTSGLALFGSILLLVQETRAEGRRVSLLHLLGAAVPAMLLAGIQIVPAALYAPLTVRALGRIPLRESLSWSVPLWRLVEFLVAYPFGAVTQARAVWGGALWSGKLAGFFYTFYAGTFAAAGVLLARPAKRLFPAGLAGASLAAAAVGFYVPDSLRKLASPIPLRYPEKFMVGVALIVALMAGWLLERLEREGGGRAARTAGTVALLLLGAAAASRAWPHAVAAFVNVHFSGVEKFGEIAARRYPGIFAGAAARWALLGAVLLLWRPAGRRPAVRIALAVFVLVDLTTVLRTSLTTAPNHFVFDPPPTVLALKKLPHNPLFGVRPLRDFFSFPISRDVLNEPRNPVLDDTRAYIFGNTAAAFGVFLAMNGDYDVSDLYRFELARRELSQGDLKGDAMARAYAPYSVRAAVLGVGRMPDGFSRRFLAARPAWIVVNPLALPRIRFAKRVRNVRNVEEAYELIHSRRIDLSEEAVVESGSEGTETFPGGRIRIVSDESDRLELDTTASGRNRLIVARAHVPFRRISLDGRSVDADPADLCLTSVVVPAGRHRVVLQDRLPGGFAGPAVSLCGLLVVAGMSLAGRDT